MTKFTRKHLCQRLSFNKVAVWDSGTRCFSVNFAKFLHFLQNTPGWLLLVLQDLTVLEADTFCIFFIKRWVSTLSYPKSLMHWTKYLGTYPYAPTIKGNIWNFLFRGITYMLLINSPHVFLDFYWNIFVCWATKFN